MGGKLDFDLLSDPLLLYALALAGLLFGGIFILIVTIVVKHSRRLHSENIQSSFISLLKLATKHHQEGKGIQLEIARINNLIQSHKKDVAYGWVRLLEQTSKLDCRRYTVIAMKTKILDCIPHCLNDQGIAEKCIALEAIGLSNFYNYTNEVKKYSLQPGLAPYACIALARLIGKESISQIIQSYELRVLTTTQALAAIVEIPHEEIIFYTSSGINKPFPKQLRHYLGFI